MDYLTTHLLASTAILFPVCRWLADREQASYGDLDQSLRPASLVQGRDSALRASLTVGRDIGLINSDGPFREGALTVSSHLSELARSQRDHWYGRPDGFRALARRALLAKAVDDIAAGTKPSDVAIGLAWLLAQDPSRPPSAVFGEGAERAIEDQQLGEFINTAEQWRALVRWAQALGCATVVGPGRRRRFVLPDPTRAILDELPPARAEGRTASEFCRAVSTSLPILDGGRISDYMRSIWAAADPRRGALIGPAFSFALKRLEHRGTIALHGESDSADRVTGLLHGGRWDFDRVSYPAGGRVD